MWDGAPTDFNIREDFPVEALERALVAFADGRGASIMTITCADAETYEEAKRDPEKYDLLRARMGGWTEFFVTMFPAHQAQHERRPLRRQKPMSELMTEPTPAVARACLVESIPVGLEDLRGTPGVQYTEDVLVRLTRSRPIHHRPYRNVLGPSSGSRR